MHAEPSSPSHARITEIYNKYHSEAMSPSRQRQASPTPLPTGPIIKTGLGVGANYLIGEYITAHGDTFVHYSCSAVECLPDHMFIRRVVVLTENALYKIPQTATETGLFFNARVALKDITQAIVADVSPSRFEVIFTGTRFGSPHQHLFTLSFGPEFELRREFLIVLSTVHPATTILHDRGAGDAYRSPQGSIQPGSPTHRTSAEEQATKAPGSPKSSLYLRSTSKADRAPGSGSTAVLKEMESDIESLRNLLHDTGAVNLLDPSPANAAPLLYGTPHGTMTASARGRSSSPFSLNSFHNNPPQQNLSSSFGSDAGSAAAREDDEERRRIRSMLDQMDQRIQQRIALQSQKKKSTSQSPARDVAVKATLQKSVAEDAPPPHPGASGKKINPDKIYLGRAYPLFQRYKLTGGLLSRSDRWTQDDSEKLIHALTKVVEGYSDAKKSPEEIKQNAGALRRAEQVLGMVQREFNFITKAQHPNVEAPSQPSKPPVSTVPRPFRLSNRSPIRFKDINLAAEAFAASVEKEGDEHRSELHKIRAQFASRQVS